MTSPGKILAPKSVVDKLGVKSESRVVLLGPFEAAFVRDVRTGARSVRKTLDASADIVLLLTDSFSALAKLMGIRSKMKPNGAVWVVRPKGVDRISEADVFAAGAAVGLVDVKVVSFSATHTAHKFVIRVKDRRA